MLTEFLAKLANTCISESVDILKALLVIHRINCPVKISGTINQIYMDRCSVHSSTHILVNCLIWNIQIFQDMDKTMKRLMINPLF